MRKTVVSEIIGQRDHVKYLPDLRDIARDDRKDKTIAEDVMWNKVLRNNKLGFKFTRQKPIHRFIADFYCSKLAMIIEIDGKSHLQKIEQDVARDQFLSKCGITSIRYKNEDVMANTEWVEKDLLEKIQRRINELR